MAREYFIRGDQGRPDLLELFHEVAEIYFPKFGRGFGRESFFEMVKGFTVLSLRLLATVETVLIQRPALDETRTSLYHLT
jgi:hypothetical protein